MFRRSDNRLVRKGDGISCLAVFALNFIIAMVAFAPMLIRDRGIFYVAGDFNQQQLMFNTLINDVLKSGGGMWNWSIDLGSDILTTMSFYNIGSVFNWIMYLMPSDIFIYTVAWIFMLKYAFAGLTSFIYLREYTEDRGAALMGSIMYVFSGFQAANIAFYHFHDAVVIFPLMMLALDRLMQGRNRGLLAVTVFFSCITNYFFFIEEVIFLVIYFFVRYLVPRPAEALRKMPLVMLEGIIGTAMAGAIFIPSILSVTGNSRTSDLISGSGSLAYGSDYYVCILRAFFFPAETMCSVSVAKNTNWSSTAAYLPLVGIMPAMAYCIKKWVMYDCIRSMIIVMCVIAAVPIFNSIFTMLTTAIYQRWYYMFDLILIIATVRVLEDKDRYDLDRPFVICIVFMVIFTAFLALYPWRWSDNASAVNDMNEFALLTGMGILGVVLTYLVMTLKLPKKSWRIILLIGIAVFGAFSTYEVTDRYQAATRANGNDAFTIRDTIGAARQLSQPEDAYRFTNDKNLIVMPGHLHGGGSFCSTITPSIMEFYSSIDLKRSVSTPDKIPEGVNAILSERYTVTEERPEDGSYLAETTYGDKTFYVTVNPNTPKIGIVYNSYMTEDEFSTMTQYSKVRQLMNSVVIRAEDEPEIRKVLKYADEEETGKVSITEQSALIDRMIQNEVQDISFGKDSFTAHTQWVADEAAVFFSVPYSDGWKAYVNGEETKIYYTSGFMTVLVPKGQSEIHFEYSTPGLDLGIKTSCAGFAALAAYVIISAIFVSRRSKISEPSEAPTCNEPPEDESQQQQIQQLPQQDQLQD